MTDRTALLAWLDMLFAHAGGGSLLEVRYKRGGAMAQLFYPCARRVAIAETIETLGRRTEAYVGVAPRSDRHGGRRSVNEVHVVWADCDGADAVERLRRFPVRPSFVVASGGDVNVHAYWALETAAAAHDAVALNRRLAHKLHADARSTDAARILRPPATRNHKGGRARPVQALLVNTDAVYRMDQLEQYAPQLPQRRSASVPRACPRVSDGDDSLRAIPAAEYVEKLAGRAPDRGGYVRCPFHSGGEERTASLKLYDNGTWTCFGSCDPPPNRDHLGGDIYTFAAQLWGLSTRHDFRELRRLLLGIFDRAIVA